jgi:predicted metalloprotease with PDZ domain
MGLSVEKLDGSVVVVEVKEGGSAASMGVEVGDTLVEMASFFGDAMWAVPS